MPKLDVVLLRPRGPFHLAERGVGIEETAELVHSDTLFSALCCAVRLGWGPKTLTDLLAAFRSGNPPFLLSSAFPYAGRVRFVPKPQLPLPVPPPDDVRKRLRQTRWVSFGLFQAWLNGHLNEQVFGGETFLPDHAAWILPEDRSYLPSSFARGATPLWRRDVVPRVSLDRVSNASNVFRSGRLWFAPECGLYVLIAWRDDTWRQLLEEAFRELGELGIGGLRSIGHGQFTPELDHPVSWPEVSRTMREVLLSLYAPTKAELASGVLGPSARYDLVLRGGWVASPEGGHYRRKEAHFVTEGSIISRPNGMIVLGQLLDVTPDIMRGLHPVYRYGFALTVPVVWEENAHGQSA